MKTISIGKQNFASLRENDCFYIDKTAFIREWWDSKDEVTLITRPRRFGKTLNMSMVECFFSNRYAGRGDLFEGLEIWKHEEYRGLQGTYPVIFLSFADIKMTDFGEAVTQIKQNLSNLYNSNTFLLEGNLLNENEKKQFKNVSPEMSNPAAMTAVRNLANYMSRYYGKNTIVILDEYDTPLQEAYAGGYWQELVSFTRSMFNSTFKTNPYLERGLMTGITRVSKESIFSDLNNLEVITTTSEKYATSFGFTEEEVFASLDEAGMSAEKERVKYWYDGFVFGSCRDIYNPWSITNFLDSGRLENYWANTSSNGLIGRLVREGEPEVKTAMEDLLTGGEVVTEIDEQIIFEQLDWDGTAIWSLLLASGYLRVVRAPEDAGDEDQDYRLALTNREVVQMFRQMVSGWFRKSGSGYGAFVRAMLAGDLEAMNYYMNEVALATFSSFDTGKSPSKKSAPERFYHGFVLGLLVDRKKDYVIHSNRESGFGRYDVVMEPLRDGLPAVIMEFKVKNPAKEKSLEETVKAALGQIGEKHYDAELLASGIPEERILKYGFAFEGNMVLIGQEENEMYNHTAARGMEK